MTLWWMLKPALILVTKVYPYTVQKIVETLHLSRLLELIFFESTKNRSQEGNHYLNYAGSSSYRVTTQTRCAVHVETSSRVLAGWGHNHYRAPSGHKPRDCTLIVIRFSLLFFFITGQVLKRSSCWAARSLEWYLKAIMWVSWSG